MKKNEVERLYLIWKNSEGKAFRIGRLKKIKNRFYFKYFYDIVEKIIDEEDFELLPKLSRHNIEYFSEELFRTFTEMLPNRRLKEGIDEISDYERLKDNLKNLNNKEFYFIDDSEEVV
ncbi:hypothetical protein [Oceanirhabdus seepicola]|uniref:Uncharacterized protein n=1 Tax=Oceanirhabdus seepicola TaxID=2828781 RepID=A0A9J6P0J9_9CLOT|nr:hypothetical protein [Oceanirhabdus seepicola]MCM1989908.1 hypothetical protein [Oceanirhabdus seepicola]